MKFFLGLIVGVVVAILIGVGAVAVAFGHLDNIEIADRDKTADILKTYEFADFDSIDVAGVYELEVAVGEAFSVEISGPENELERVRASVSNGRLVLDQNERKRGGKRWRNHQGVSARISMPTLVSIEASGVVDGTVTGVSSDEFRVEISGVGDMDLAGECGDLVARVSGVGDLDAEELLCKTVDINVSGVGDATVYASESVDASVGGMGEITVYGSPKSVEKSGGFFSSINVK